MSLAKVSIVFQRTEHARLARATRTTGPSLSCGTCLVSTILTLRPLMLMDAPTTPLLLTTVTGLPIMVSRPMELCATLATKVVSSLWTTSITVPLIRLHTSPRHRDARASLRKILCSPLIDRPVFSPSPPTSTARSCNSSLTSTSSILLHHPHPCNLVSLNGVPFLILRLVCSLWASTVLCHSPWTLST